MTESLFTKIIKREIPSHKVYEDEYTYAFLDIHPRAPGHTLVVSKKQVEFVWDLDDETYQHVMAATKKIASHLREVLGVPYVGVQIVGVDVPHAHVQIIPFTSAATDYYGTQDMTSEPDHAALAVVATKVAL